jgi:hypothetical protein
VQQAGITRACRPSIWSFGGGDEDDGVVSIRSPSATSRHHPTADDLKWDPPQGEARLSHLQPRDPKTMSLQSK